MPLLPSRAPFMPAATVICRLSCTDPGDRRDHAAWLPDTAAGAFVTAAPERTRRPPARVHAPPPFRAAVARLRPPGTVTWRPGLAPGPGTAAHCWRVSQSRLVSILGRSFLITQACRGERRLQPGERRRIRNERDRTCR